MSPQPQLTASETQLFEAYHRVLNEPFAEKYEERWEDEPFDRAVKEFKALSEELGFPDPFEVLGQFRITSYEQAREDLKRGPPMCFRPGWKSPLLGERIDSLSLVRKCEHISGPVFLGTERVVVLDFWASWCGPCEEAGPALSDLADEFEGRVAVIGINNESIFGDTKEANVETLVEFLEAHQEGFRYTIYVDTDDGFAKESVYKPAGYRGIPCIVLVVDGEVIYVGSPQDGFRETLEKALELVAERGELEE